MKNKPLQNFLDEMGINSKAVYQDFNTGKYAPQIPWHRFRTDYYFPGVHGIPLKRLAVYCHLYGFTADQYIMFCGG